MTDERDYPDISIFRNFVNRGKAAQAAVNEVLESFGEEKLDGGDRKVSIKTLEDLLARASEELETAANTLLDATRELEYIKHKIGEKW